VNEYRVDVDTYNGPLDLLLFLIKREEVDIYDIPISLIARHYCQYVEILHVLDPNLAGDFLVMLATLMELKSRALLPRAEVVDDEETFDDPRLELVRQLLAYKSFKDAARRLGLAAEVQSFKFPRKPSHQKLDSTEMDIEDVSIWALVQAFGTLLEQTGKGKITHDVVSDETPIALHADDLMDSLQHRGGSQIFESVFAGRTKIEMIGLFLALLELIRQHRVRVSQDVQFGPVTIHLILAAPLDEPVTVVNEGQNEHAFGVARDAMDGGSADVDTVGATHDAIDQDSEESGLDQIDAPPQTLEDDKREQVDGEAGETRDPALAMTDPVSSDDVDRNAPPASQRQEESLS